MIQPEAVQFSHLTPPPYPIYSQYIPFSLTSLFLVSKWLAGYQSRRRISVILRGIRCSSVKSIVLLFQN